MNAAIRLLDSWRAAWIVFRKELADALRDRRTLAVVLLSSVAMGPLVMALISVLVDKMERQAEAREVVAVGLDHAPTLRNFLERQTLEIRAAPADWEARLQDNTLGEPVLVVPDDFEAALGYGRAAQLRIVFSSGNGRAAASVGRVRRALQGFQQEQATLRLLSRGVSPSALQVIEIDVHDLADNAARAAQLTGMLPFFVLMAVVYGALNAALDTTAGERERGSLEPLLATPASRRALVLGKWGAVFTVGLLIAVMSCLSFLPGQWLIRSESLAALFRFGAGEAAQFIGLIAPLAAAVSALMMAVAIRCRSIKEAQASNTVVVLAMSMLPLVTLLNQEGEAPWHLWLPALAQMTLMTRVLKGLPLPLADVMPGVLTCAAITAAALAYVGRDVGRRPA